ncbi:hypothetical protein NDU88_002635 [Pleurodeles waltl]|uniref:Uncharacterized protein n=1 Tax=Pleurodeles waltl TaxID=8319 RepID=A0AAV7QCB5_PLEWA|nr:hypothetical protein NDU88_002635 [Pleurodeles waltl]
MPLSETETPEAALTCQGRRQAAEAVAPLRSERRALLAWPEANRRRAERGDAEPSPEPCREDPQSAGSARS